MARMKLAKLKRIFRPLPKGLPLRDLAVAINQKLCTARTWAIKAGYRYSDGRSCWATSRLRAARSFNYDAIDWTLPNAELARRHGISRERVRQIRDKLGVGKP